MILLVDSNSLLHRAYHALPLSLVTSDGQPVNAVYGLASMLLDAILKLKPKYVVCAFDSREPTFRHKEFADYKAHRPKTDAELVHQIELAKKVVKALGIPVFEKPGYEADDIIATIVTQLQKQGLLPGKLRKALILTSDKDLFALVNKYVHVVMPQGNFKNLKEFGPKDVYEKMGVVPAQMYDYKALVGDASDNIPGVRGVGPKTAVALLNQYKTLENIYKNLEDIKQVKQSVYNKLSQGYEDAMLSYKIVQIKTDVPIVFELEQASLKGFDFEKAYELFMQLEFKSLIPKLKDMYKMVTGRAPVISNKSPTHINTTKFTTTPIKLPLSQILQEPEKLAEIFKTPILYLFYQDAFVYVPLHSVKPSEIQNLTKEFFKFQPADLKINVSKKLTNNANISIGYGWFELVKKLIQHSMQQAATQVSHTKQTQMQLLNTAGQANQAKTVISIAQILEILSKIPPMLDIQLAAYVLAAGRQSYNLPELAIMYLNSSIEHISPSSQQNQEALLKSVHAIAQKQTKDLLAIVKNYAKTSDFLASIIDPFTSIAVNIMTANGITIDLNHVQEYQVWLKEKIKDLEFQIHESVGFSFNINSTKQLSHILYNVLNLPVTKKKKTVYSTDNQSLLNIYDTHPVIPLILEYRKLQKIHSTYVKPFLQMQVMATDAQNTLRLHSTFNPIKTSTGRLASSNPNLQNLPIRTPEGAKIRTFFKPAPDHIFVKFDYSQIDLRVLAHTSKDKHLIDAFKQGLDIHRQTAAKIFNIDYDSVDKNQRRIAKTINFGIVYGMSAHGLAQTLGITHSEAKNFIQKYFEQFPGVIEYIKKIEAFVKEHGFVLSLLGRRRFIYGIDSNNYARRQAALREAINMPIQGGSDDILRTAMTKLFTENTQIQQNVAKLVLQIHDELIFEVPQTPDFTDLDDKNSWANQVKSIMEQAVTLLVPLKVGVEVSASI